VPSCKTVAGYEFFIRVEFTIAYCLLSSLPTSFFVLFLLQLFCAFVQNSCGLRVFYSELNLLQPTAYFLHCLLLSLCSFFPIYSVPSCKTVAGYEFFIRVEFTIAYCLLSSLPTYFSVSFFSTYFEASCTQKQ
jgi:hypothetical protein